MPSNGTVSKFAKGATKEMFPKAKKLLGAEELRDLGRRIKQRKQELGAE